MSGTAAALADINAEIERASSDDGTGVSFLRPLGLEDGDQQFGDFLADASDFAGLFRGRDSGSILEVIRGEGAAATALEDSRQEIIDRLTAQAEGLARAADFEAGFVGSGGEVDRALIAAADGFVPLIESAVEDAGPIEPRVVVSPNFDLDEASLELVGAQTEAFAGSLSASLSDALTVDVAADDSLATILENRRQQLEDFAAFASNLQSLTAAGQDELVEFLTVGGLDQATSARLAGQAVADSSLAVRAELELEGQEAFAAETNALVSEVTAAANAAFTVDATAGFGEAAQRALAGGGLAAVDAFGATGAQFQIPDPDPVVITADDQASPEVDEAADSVREWNAVPAGSKSLSVSVAGTGGLADALRGIRDFNNLPSTITKRLSVVRSVTGTTGPISAFDVGLLGNALGGVTASAFANGGISASSYQTGRGGIVGRPRLDRLTDGSFRQTGEGSKRELHRAAKSNSYVF